jgi:hypothetical protein
VVVVIVALTMVIILQLKNITLGLRVISLTNLIVEKKNVYGVERVYPVCNKAKLFASISGNKTLLPEVIEQIKKLGYNLTTEREKI